MERLEIGDSTVVEGPSGTVFTGAEPEWDKVTVTRAPDATHPDLELIWALPAALAEVPGDNVLTQQFATLANFDPARGHRVALDHDPNGCAACIAATTAGLAVCVGLTWGLGSIFCGIIAAGAYAACASTVCL